MVCSPVQMICTWLQMHLYLSTDEDYFLDPIPLYPHSLFLFCLILRFNIKQHYHQHTKHTVRFLSDCYTVCSSSGLRRNYHYSYPFIRTKKKVESQGWILWMWHRISRECACSLSYKVFPYRHPVCSFWCGGYLYVPLGG